MIWTTALVLGYQNVFNLTRKQLSAVKERLLDLNKQVHGYYDGEEQLTRYVLDAKVAVLNSWFDPSQRLLSHDKRFKLVIPKEGAVGMFDSYLISKSSEKQAMAYRYINYQVSPEIQKEMVAVTGLAPSNIETMALMSAEQIKSMHLDEPDYFNRMILWDVMPRKHLYEQVLEEVRQDLNGRLTP